MIGNITPQMPEKLAACLRPGVATRALAYEWPAEQREAMLKMEQAVYREMRDSQ